MRLGVNTLFLVPGDVGGTETYVRETLRAAAATFPEVELVLFTNRENTPLFAEIFGDTANVTCVPLNFSAATRPSRIILEQTLLPLVVGRHRIDLLWSPGYTAPFYCRCPQVVTVCDLQYKRYPEDMSWLERVTLDFLVRGACRWSSAVLAISEFSRREINHHKFAGADKTYSHLLGVDPSFACEHNEEEISQTLSQLSIPRPFILAVAHSYPHKKLDLLVEAFSLVESQIPHNLVIVGKARRGEAKIEAAVKRLNNPARYQRFDQGIPFRSLQHLYHAADMFVLPSAYEGFGLPVIEAMLSGTPVLTSNEASLAEVGGQHAFRFEEFSAECVAENIIHVLQLDTGSRQHRVGMAKQWAASFTWKRTAEQMFTVFNNVLSKRITTQ
jgi:glycosyltransferase involved in cell wall biosynthesis